MSLCAHLSYLRYITKQDKSKMFTKSEIAQLNETLQASMTTPKVKTLELTTSTVQALLDMSEASFQSLIKRGFFYKNPYQHFDNSGVAEHGNPFNPAPCYFSPDGN